jgi:16S rRNA (cytosine1402-N4)-methyltransferase
MADEAVSHLAVKQGGVYVDGTVEGAGHSLLILDKLYGSGAVLIGIDRDEAAAEVSASRLRIRNEELGGLARCEVVHSNYAYIDKICENQAVRDVDGILLDLGVSSYQLDEAERGFSFQRDSALDMRMDRRDKTTAADIVNGSTESGLAEIIWKYGEERWAARISKFIVERRSRKPIRTTFELVDAILAAIPKNARNGASHPATRTFLALRIETNSELAALEETIHKSARLLKPGGRLCVIGFHSLEDRIVKNAMRDLSSGCVCPKKLPVCVCGRTPMLKLITRKPITPGASELKTNPRSRSAKLRAAEKIGAGGIASLA